MFRNFKILKLFSNNTKLRRVKEKMLRNYKILKLFTNNTKLRSDKLNIKINTTKKIKNNKGKILRTKHFLLKAKEYKLKT